MPVIHRDTHPFSLGPRWTVIADPNMDGRWDLVRFRRVNKLSGKHKTVLDQTARWTVGGWDRQHWIPTHPQVPRTLLSIVERLLREAEVA